MKKLLKVTINNKEYQVAVEEIGDEISTENHVSSEPIAKPKELKSVETPSVVSKPQVSSSNNTIDSPMPGNILDIKCNAGQNVKAGDVLFILEAMKMENEIVAPRDCIISNVLVNKGQSVVTSQSLCEIE